MTDVLIRNVPDEVVRRLNAAAVQHGRSLEAEALDAVQRGMLVPARFSVDEARARVKRNMARYSHPLPSVPLDEIREGLDGAM